jgi:hypothetical protein
MRENNSTGVSYKQHLSKAERKGLTNREKSLLRNKKFFDKYKPNFLK